MRILIMCVLPERQEYFDYLSEKLPEAEIVLDETKNAMDTFRKALKTAGTDAILLMEDDAQLGAGFLEKVTAAIDERPDEVNQFFSRRKKDLEVGSRYETGSTYMYNVCVYLPAGFAAGLLEFSENWERYGEHPTGTDTMLADYLLHTKARYYVHVPSLVQHRVGKSVINSKRSSNRTSQTFIGEEENL